MTELIFSLFPKPNAEIAGTAIVALYATDTDSFSVIIVPSKAHAIALAETITMEVDKCSVLKQVTNSPLPTQSESEPIILPMYSAARVVNVYLSFQERGEQAQIFDLIYPNLMTFEVTSRKQGLAFEHISTLYDFMALTINTSGATEIIIGFSRAQTRECLSTRESWNIDDKTRERWERSIDTSALPEHSDRDVLCIRGAAAGFIYELALIDGLHRLTVN